MIYWLYLLISIVLEIAWALSVKWTAGYTKLLPTLFNLTLVTIDLFVFAKALQGIPTSISYAIYVAAGIAGVTIFAYLTQQEQFSSLKLLFLSLTFIGIFGLQFLSIMATDTTYPH